MNAYEELLHQLQHARRFIRAKRAAGELDAGYAEDIETSLQETIETAELNAPARTARSEGPPPIQFVPTLPKGFVRSELLACIDRELWLRERTYDRLVRTGRMSGADAGREMGLMKAVRAIVAQLPAPPPPQTGLFRAVP